MRRRAGVRMRVRVRVWLRAVWICVVLWNVDVRGVRVCLLCLLWLLLHVRRVLRPVSGRRTHHRHIWLRLLWLLRRWACDLVKRHHWHVPAPRQLHAPARRRRRCHCRRRMRLAAAAAVH